MRELSGELDYRIRYDVEHGLFHAQNIFNDEYIKPTFIEYVQKLEKEVTRLRNENLDIINKYTRFAETDRRTIAELKEKANILDNCDRLGDVITEAYKEQLTNAKELILRLYNAGRDVLMCRAEEKAYDNLSNAINDKSIEQFLSEVGK